MTAMNVAWSSAAAVDVARQTAAGHPADTPHQQQPAVCGVSPSRWPFYYGWVIVAVCFVIRLNSVAAASSQMMTFVVPAILRDPQGLPDTELMSIYAVANVLAAAASPFLGRAVDVHGSRCCATLGCAALAAALTLLGAATGSGGYLAAFILV